MRKITQTIVGTTPPLDKNVVWLDSTDSTAPVEKVFINGQWTPMGVDTDDYYTKDEINNKLDEKLDVIENPVNGNLIAMNSQGQATNSGKKTTDFIANPEVAGQNGEVLSVDSEGKPVWTTVTPTGTADTEMSDSSTNAVQNKVIKAYVDDNYAKKDGYYSQMTVGSAENLVGQTVDKDAYLIRPTATSDEATNEVANGVAYVLGMEGNSTVWNQLLTGFHVASGNATVQNNKITINGVATIDEASVTNIIGHKYLVRLSYNSTINGTMNLNDFLTGSSTKITNIPSNKNSIAYINTATRARTDTINIICSSYTSGTFVGYLNLFDLTLLGIDNLTEVDKVEEWLAQHVGTKPYYAYNPGTILSAQTLGIKTYGQNLLNPTTKQAKLIPYEWIDGSTNNSNKYTIKNVPSADDLQITYTPDATGVAVTIDTTESIPDSIDVSDYGGSGVLYISSATADTYVCMKWDEQKDDDVVPYEDHTYDFDVRKIYGKNGGVEYQCYPNGMRSVDNVHDVLTAEEAVSNIYLKTFVGTDTYQYNSENFIIKNISPLAKTFGTKERGKGIANKFGMNDSTSAGYPVGYKWDITDPNIFAFNRSLIPSLATSTDTNDFKNWLITQNQAGTPLQVGYIRATPLVYTDLIYRDGGVDRPLADVLMNIEVNNWSIEEQLMTPYDENGNPTSIPVTISTKYGMDAVEQIDTLNKTCYFADDVKANLQALLTCINTNCAETLGGTFAISETATDKVFEFTFAPTTEPDVEPTNEGE